jgi:hypothetical protein
MLPITHHKVQWDQGILNVQGRVRILCRTDRCRHLLQLELMNLILEVINLNVSVRELNLMLLQLLLTLM